MPAEVGNADPPRAGVITGNAWPGAPLVPRRSALWVAAKDI